MKDLQGKNVLLTGPPGCGKTTAILRLVERLGVRGWPVSTPRSCASTGTASASRRSASLGSGPSWRRCSRRRGSGSAATASTPGGSKR
jgi:hypothetical protein